MQSGAARRNVERRRCVNAQLRGYLAAAPTDRHHWNDTPSSHPPAEDRATVARHVDIATDRTTATRPRTTARIAMIIVADAAATNHRAEYSTEHRAVVAGRDW